MLLNRFNTDVGSSALPTYVPSTDELAIMALGPSRWFEARTDRGLVLDEASAVKAWVDRARGAKYVPLIERPGTTGTGAVRPVVFTGTAAKALVADDASEAFMSATTYSMAFLAKQAVASYGGAPFGTASDINNVAHPWFNPAVNGALNYFTRGQAGNALGGATANNDNAWHVFTISIDTTQATQANRYAVRRDGLNASALDRDPVSLATVAGSKRLTLGGAGRAGQITPFIGSLGAAIVIPDVALHLSANADKLALVEGYLDALRVTLP